MTMARRKGVNGWEKLAGLSSLEQVSFESGFKDWERVQVSEVWEERVPELEKHAPHGAEAGDREVSGGGGSEGGGGHHSSSKSAAAAGSQNSWWHMMRVNNQQGRWGQQRGGGVFPLCPACLRTCAELAATTRSAAHAGLQSQNAASGLQ